MKKHIALTITSCKRPDEFEITIDSLCEKMLDMYLVDTIIHYDDCSDEVARQRMRTKLNSKFPDKLIAYRTFEKESFSTNKRHMSVMNHWLDDLKRLGVDLVFHTEEDWLYTNEFRIADAMTLMSQIDNCAQVGVSQIMRRFPDDIPIKTYGNFWEWPYLPQMGITENLFMDHVVMEEFDVPGFWCYFINWPHFSLRPGLYDVKMLDSVGRFRDTENSFELDFAERFAERFVLYASKEQFCRHIGNKSSYEENKSDR